MNISFNGIGAQRATFLYSGEDINIPVKVTAAGTVSACDEDDGFDGFLYCTDGTYAGVQLAGVVTAAYSGTAPDYGTVILAADGDGGVAAAEEGRSCIVLDLDSTAGTVTFLM